VRFQPKTLITSPLTRAQQTAAYVCQANPELQPITLPELASGVKPDGIRNALLQADWMWPLLYVGHMPDLALFSSRITHDPALMETMVEPGETLAFETGAWQTGWGTGQLLWRRKIDEWKKAKEL
jgi:phosphohistidine phosphatase SixA